MDQLRSQRNSDVDLVSFCADQDKKFERDQARLKDAVDVEESGIQMHEAQIADLSDAQKDGTTTSAAVASVPFASSTCLPDGAFSFVVLSSSIWSSFDTSPPLLQQSQNIAPAIAHEGSSKLRKSNG